MTVKDTLMQYADIIIIIAIIIALIGFIITRYGQKNNNEDARATGSFLNIVACMIIFSLMYVYKIN